MLLHWREKKNCCRLDRLQCWLNAGGVGKTTLAREYLKTQGFDLILDLPMAKEKENITAIDGEKMAAIFWLRET
jgi:hypothetical protein